MYRSLYTGSMPTQMPPHAFAEWKGWVMYLVNDAKSAIQNLHCFRAYLRRPTRAAKYQVNSLRSFIRSSLKYVALVIKPIILNCKIQQCLRIVLRVVPSWCRSMRRAVSSCRSPACWLLAINKWRSNSPTFGIF